MPSRCDPAFAEAHFNLGNLLKETGRVDEAIAAWRLAIKHRPDFATAYGNLGNALRGRGQREEAVANLRQAISLNPRSAIDHNNLGVALQEAGNLPEAVAAFRQAIALNRDYADAHGNLGAILKMLGESTEALIECRKAVALNPNHFQGYGNLAGVLNEMGDHAGAIAAAHRAIAINPRWPVAYNNLGCALQESGRFDEAMNAIQRALALNPTSADAHSNLGGLLNETLRFDDALDACNRAIALSPRHAVALTNLGNALAGKGRIDEAISRHQQAMALEPHLAEPHNNHAHALKLAGRLEESIAAGRRAIQLKPDYPTAHANLAMSLLAKGKFSEGWDEYEWRWKLKDLRSPRRHFSQPIWDGEPISGTLLLHAEQGFGDTLQFIRYLPMVAARAKKVVVECQPGLQKVLQSMSGGIFIIAHGEALPAFDCHCPLLSLPRIFSTTIDTIPASIPYLRAEPESIEVWRQRVAPHLALLKIGIAWAGSKIHKADNQRSLPLSAFAALGETKNATFFSLQKGEPAIQAAYPPAGMNLVDFTADLRDFADTAALIANLDLVISVDTSVAHLAGAMGKEVWTLLPFVPDWRWLMDRDDSPWYPTMRLFRQRAADDWPGVMRQVADALRDTSQVQH